MRIGILGTGNVGQTLANGLSAKGHEVVVGTRDPAGKRLEKWRGKVVPFAEAASYGEVVLFCVLGEAVEEVVRLTGADRLAGKLVIDTTNGLDFSKGMPPGLLHGLTDSCGEKVQRAAPQAKVVKAFNTVSHPQMIAPYPGSRMLICGDDAHAKARVESLLRELGWAGAVDIGGIAEARWLEAAVPLWVRIGAALGRWDHYLDVRHG